MALVLPLVLLAIGFVYETVASGSDWDRYPPPGELIDIGAYRLHLHCTGERGAGQPAVIIEAGAGSSSPDWVLDTGHLVGAEQPQQVNTLALEFCG